jgi:hypothetical protein
LNVVEQRCREVLKLTAELGDDVEQASIEALEGIVWQVGEQLARESAVAVNERQLS